MAKNSLFNFLNSIHDPAIDPTQKPNLSFKIEKKGGEKEKRYFLIHLPPHANLYYHDESKIYTLRNHHISIYSAQYNSIKALSQYHYTAMFSDTEGNSYKLHVYFDGKDNQKGEPHFSKVHKNSSENDQKGIPVQLSSHLEGHFSTLAYQCVQMPISLLRAQQIKIKKQLIQDYEKHEQLATELSCDLKTNRDEYLLHLDKLIQITHHLGYVTENNHYQSANNILTLRRTVLLEDNKTPNTRKKPHNKSIQSNTGTRKAQATSRKQSSAQKQTNSKRNATNKYQQEICQLTQRFKELQHKEDLSTRAQTLIDIQNETSGILGSLTFEHSSQLTANSLEQLVSLQTNLKNYGRSLFDQLVKEEQYELAGTIGFYYPFIDDSILATALQTNNPTLLDFALNYGGFSINNQPIEIDGNLYKNAVYYCFSCNSKKHPMADCLSVLIKHGASLMMPSNNGLPLINSILSSSCTKHPLIEALKANSEQTLDSRYFYLRLANTLRHYLATHEQLAANKKEKIIKDIEFYQSRADELGLLTKTSGRVNTVLNKKAKWMSTLPIDDFPPDLLKDKDIQVQCSTIKLLTESFFANLESTQQSAMKKILPNWLDSSTLIESEDLQAIFSKLPNMEDRKAFALLYLKDYESLWSMYNQLSTIILQYKSRNVGASVIKDAKKEISRMEEKYKKLKENYGTEEKTLDYFYSLQKRDNNPTEPRSVFAGNTSPAFFQPVTNTCSDPQIDRTKVPESLHLC